MQTSFLDRLHLIIQIIRLPPCRFVCFSQVIEESPQEEEEEEEEEEELVWMEGGWKNGGTGWSHSTYILTDAGLSASAYELAMLWSTGWFCWNSH